jgi:hypothetical protein
VKNPLRLLGLLVLVVSLGVGCESDAVAPEASVKAFANYLDAKVSALLDHYAVPDADTTPPRPVRV